MYWLITYNCSHLCFKDSPTNPNKEIYENILKFEAEGVDSRSTDTEVHFDLVLKVTLFIVDIYFYQLKR